MSSPGRSAGRVIGGSASGLRLVSPGEGTRPLSDRVKQSLFGTVAETLPGSRVLDLFAGSGAAGIEALSRGAAWADLVERDPKAASSIKANLHTTGLADRAAVHLSDATRFLERAGDASSRQRYDLVILDPPYGDAAMLAALEVLGRGAVLTPEAIVVAKHFWRDAPPARMGVLRTTRAAKRFGETALTWYVRAPDEAAAPEGLP